MDNQQSLLVEQKSQSELLSQVIMHSPLVNVVEYYREAFYQMQHTILPH